MPTTASAIEAVIAEVATPGFREKLIARGQARAMIWRDGALPDGSPTFSPLLSYDLHSYGYSLLGLGLRLRELGGDPSYARLAFQQSATALEAAIAKGRLDDPNRDFHFIIAASGYHLAQLSARAYSLLSMVRSDENFSTIERALAHLMFRDLNSLERMTLSFRAGGVGSDERVMLAIAASISEQQSDELTRSPALDGLDLSLTDNFFSAMALFLFALERGERHYLDLAADRLQEGVSVCGEVNFVPQWWANRIARHLIMDLWDSSFHERLPLMAKGGEATDWPLLRQLFIASLLSRSKAEIDLWPSQIAAANRAVDQSDDLVVSLPTSAGKTRISELCILRCLAGGKRVVFVTPLRALSAQTETTLQRTFGPLGKTVSALYGSIGVSRFDDDAIRQRHIVVATPEKLDFALRSDPSLLNDVGLLVFDEGHMIGLSEREVRYEVQIQRLLKRQDAHQRRIVCLSAVLPDGDQLEDFASWLRRDQPGGLVKSEWRPTRLRFGEVVWSGQSAHITLRVGDERPFVRNYLSAFVPPVGRRTKPFPSDLPELCLATAWRLVNDGQSVLIYCPVKRNVEPFAGRIVDLHARGALRSLLAVDEKRLEAALALGAEWLGSNHPVLRCLKLGVAIHHGSLPTAYRKEVERLLHDGVLKVTVSSPTLAQGLNLSATAVIMHSLSRGEDPIDASEFKNVTGRAGRAYVDIEGLVIYPMFDRVKYRTRHWEKLISDVKTREMESGLIRLVVTLAGRLLENFDGSASEFIEYVMNNSWQAPETSGPELRGRARAKAEWLQYVSTLDTAILSMVGENDVPANDLAAALDAALHSSLWARRLRRFQEDSQQALKAIMLSRAQFIWSRTTAVRRKGYFLAGVGFDTGQALDDVSTECNALLVRANGGLLAGDCQLAIDAIVRIAQRVFAIPPFTPDVLPDNWPAILRAWLMGSPLADVTGGREQEAVQFIETGVVYRLAWAMEALRVRGIANGDAVGDLGARLEEFELGLAVAAVETGTLDRAASILIQSGFSSRLAAIKVVSDTGASFSTSAELRQWLHSDAIRALSALPDWPTPETKGLWQSFNETSVRLETQTWGERRWLAKASWSASAPPPSGTSLRVVEIANRPVILSPDGLPIGDLLAPLSAARRGIVRASTDEAGDVVITYLGPDDLWRVQA